MFCANCGKEVSEGWAACPQCGKSLQKDDKEAIPIKNAIKKSKTLWIILGVVAGVLLIGILVVGALLRGNDNSKPQLSQAEEEEVIDKLYTFTTVYIGDGKYFFLGDEEKWVLTYTRENEFVTFENDTVLECFTEAFGEGCFSGDDVLDLGFSYDLSDDEARIYFDVDIEEGHLSIISYNLTEQEYEIMVDGEKWSPKKVFVDFVKEYGLVDAIESDVEEFKAILQQHDLTIEDLLGVKYNTLVSQFVPESEAAKNDVANMDGDMEATSLGWKEAYVDYLYQIGNTEYEYSLDYIDGDEIPELIINFMNAAEGIYLCTYDGKNVIATPMGETIQYRLQENMICVSGGRMDYYYDVLYEIIDGVPVEIAKGEYGVLDSQNIKYDQEGYMVYEYSWNGERISEYEYYTFLDVFYNGDDSTTICCPSNDYLYDVIEVLSHPLDITIISPYLNEHGYESMLNHYVILFDGIENDKLHFTVMYNGTLIASASATIVNATTAEYKNANSELVIEFGLSYGQLIIEGYMDTIDLTGSYTGRWG